MKKTIKVMEEVEKEIGTYCDYCKKDTKCAKLEWMINGGDYESNEYESRDVCFEQYCFLKFLQDALYHTSSSYDEIIYVPRDIIKNLMETLDREVKE